MQKVASYYGFTFAKSLQVVMLGNKNVPEVTSNIIFKWLVQYVGVVAFVRFVYHVFLNYDISVTNVSL